MKKYPLSKRYQQGGFNPMLTNFGSNRDSSWLDQPYQGNFNNQFSNLPSQGGNFNAGSGGYTPPSGNLPSYTQNTAVGIGGINDSGYTPPPSTGGLSNFSGYGQLGMGMSTFGSMMEPNSDAGGILQGAGAGLQMGSVFGPVGAGIGGGVGAALGFMGARKRKNAERRAKRKEKQQEKRYNALAQQQQSDAILANYDSDGTGAMDFKHGGTMTPFPYKTNSTAINPTHIMGKDGSILYQMGGTVPGMSPEEAGNYSIPQSQGVMGGQLQPISGDAAVVQGNDPNSTDGVGIPGGAFVDHNEMIKERPEGLDIFSDTLKPPGSKKTFATLAKTLEKQKKDSPIFEEANDHIEGKIEELFEIQQLMNGDSHGEESNVPTIPGEQPGMGYDPQMNPGANMFMEGGQYYMGGGSMDELTTVQPMSFRYGGRLRNRTQPSHATFDPHWRRPSAATPAVNPHTTITTYTQSRKEPKQGHTLSHNINNRNRPLSTRVAKPTRKVTKKSSNKNYTPTDAQIKKYLNKMVQYENGGEYYNEGMREDQMQVPYPGSIRERQGLGYQAGGTYQQQDAPLTLLDVDRLAELEKQGYYRSDRPIGNKYKPVNNSPTDIGASLFMVPGTKPTGNPIGKPVDYVPNYYAGNKGPFKPRAPISPIATPPGYEYGGKAYQWGGREEGERSKFANFFNQENTGNLINAGSIIAENLNNRRLIDQMPEVPEPYTQNAVRLGRVNPNNQINEINRASRTAQLANKNNTLPGAQASLNGAITAKALYAQNAAYDRVDKQNTQIDNQETGMNAGIQARNLDKLGQYNRDKVSRDMSVLQQKGANTANTLTQMRGTIFQNDQRRRDKAAMLLRLAGDVSGAVTATITDNPEMFKDVFDRKTLNSIVARGQADKVELARAEEKRKAAKTAEEQSAANKEIAALKARIAAQDAQLAVIAQPMSQ